MKNGIEIAKHDALDDLIGILRERRQEQFFMEEQFKTAFFDTSRAMCIVSLDGYFKEVNDAACRLWLRSREELLTLRWQDITYYEDVEEDEQEVNMIIQGKTASYQMAKRYDLPNGDIIRAHLEVTVVKDHLRYPQYLISRVYSERSLREMLKVLEKLHL